MTSELEFARILRREVSSFLQLPADIISQLYGHFLLLQRWNRVVNLVSLRSLEQAATRHYGESLFLAANLPPDTMSVADVGSGGGFPGFPLAIVRPDLHISLIESDKRKGAFLREAIRDVPNAEVLVARAETLDRAFDTVISRAVRWEDVASFARRRSRYFAVLVGEVDAREISGQRAFRAAKLVQLPWGDRRFLLVGSLNM